MTMPLARRFIRRIMASGQAMVSLAADAQSRVVEYRWRQTGDQQFIRLADDTCGSY